MIYNNLDEAVEGCKKWQEILSLQHWEIAITISRSRDSSLKGRGEVNFSLGQLEASITLIDPIDYPDSPHLLDHEETLIHELLHLWIGTLNPMKSSLENDPRLEIVEEQCINILARALVSLSRDLERAEGREQKLRDNQTIEGKKGLSFEDIRTLSTQELSEKIKTEGPELLEGMRVRYTKLTERVGNESLLLEGKLFEITPQVLLNLQHLVQSTASEYYRLGSQKEPNTRTVEDDFNIVWDTREAQINSDPSRRPLRDMLVATLQKDGNSNLPPYSRLGIINIPETAKNIEEYIQKIFKGAFHEGWDQSKKYKYNQISVDDACQNYWQRLNIEEGDKIINDIEKALKND